jgi:hypothetical protein
MNNLLLLLFALPISTIILASVLETIIHSPIKITAIFFALYLIVAFSAFDATFLIYAILYTILAFISAVLTRIIYKLIHTFEEEDEEEENTCNTSSATINTLNTTLNTQNLGIGSGNRNLRGNCNYSRRY